MFRSTLASGLRYSSLPAPRRTLLPVEPAAPDALSASDDPSQEVTEAPGRMARTIYVEVNSEVSRQLADAIDV